MIVDGSGNERAAADPAGNFRRRNEPPASKPREIELDTGRSRRIKRSRTARRRKTDIGGIGSLSRDKMPGDSKRARSEKAPFGGGSRFGTTSHLGRRGAMEDAVAAELGFLSRGGRSYDFYGVYDGHGGRRVANACSETMHKLMAKFLEDEIRVDQINWGETMTASFRGMDEEVNKIGDEVATVGSTAVVAVVGEEEVVVANCGDSRAVLCRGGVAVQISDDHKPDRPDELERIELCGGKVINWNGARVLGVLATSRSIGDQYLKPFVIPEPEVKIIDRTKSDEFLILASDGLWDVVSNDLACKVTRRCLDGRIGIRSSIFENESNRASEDRFAEAARVLVELAMVRGGSDNVSVIVVNMS